jgi:alanine racemase
VLAIVMANAYGHGLLPSARAALAGGAQGLGVAIPDEALALRDGGIGAPILILGAPDPDSAPDVVHAGVSQVVSDRRAVQAFSDAAQAHGSAVGLHLKVDTGMARVGAAPEDAVDLARSILAMPGLRLDGVCTHFATADEDPAYMAEQNACFRRVLAQLSDAGIRPRYRHAANSGAIQESSATTYDLVRPGLLTYGWPPLPEKAPHLLPALQWKARLVQVRTLPAGTGVGYGLTARLKRPSRLAIVPLGYADGWPRSLSNRGRVLVRGKWAPVVGRVSMDQFTIDVTDIPGAEVGDEAVLIGEQAGRRQSIDEVAAAAGTNAHEILSGLGARLPRVYIRP